MAIDPNNPHNKLLTMGSGILLLVFSITVVVFDSSNFLAIGLAFFVLMGGLALVMVGAVNGLDNNNKKKDSGQAQTTTQIVREVVKVRCKYCNALNFETSQRCSNCGGQL